MVSRDILFITLAACAAVVTFFFAWFSLSLIRILREVSEVVSQVQARIERIGSAIEGLTSTVTHSALSISSVASGVKEILGWLGRKRRSGKSSARDDSE